MTPNEWRKARIFDTDYDNPDPPRPDRLSGWLAVGLWTLAALVAGAVIAVAG
jgi:hypothetical protein